MNPFYSAIRRPQANPLQYLQQFKSNPLQYLMRSKFKLPYNIPAGNPQAILNHLISTGQVSQAQINNAYQTAQRLGMQPSSAQTDVNNQMKG